MNLRLRTNTEEEIKLTDLQNWLHLSSKAAVMRLSIAVSLKQKEDPRLYNNVLMRYNIKDKTGMDYLRLTIFGQEDQLYKLLMINHLGKEISDEEFFPELTSFHIQRGLNYLHSEYRYLNDKNKFIIKLLELSDK